jgi:hypothetical protein
MPGAFVSESVERTSSFSARLDQLYVPGVKSSVEKLSKST